MNHQDVYEVELPLVTPTAAAQETQGAIHDLQPQDTNYKNSPLYNSDLAPLPSEKRTWTTYNFAALWISMAHCIPTYMLAGGLVSVGMNWWQALMTIALGNIIVLIPILLNAHPGTKYGIPFPVLARSSFGTKGANIPAILRAIVACGWFGIQTYIGGEAVKTFIEIIWPQYGLIGGGIKILGLSIPSMITFLFFWFLNILIIYCGMEYVKIFENWAAPIVLVLAAGLLIWVVVLAGGIGPILYQPSEFSTLGEFWKVFIPSLTGMIGFWATLSLNVPDFTRYGKGQKEQILGQVLGLPTTMIAFSAMGVVITSASQVILNHTPVQDLWDPVTVIQKLTSAEVYPGRTEPFITNQIMRIAVAIISLLGVAIATISVNIAANVVSPANDFGNLAPRSISFKTGGLITGVIGILIMPWNLLESANMYIFEWLVGYSALLGPIAGIMIVDYWVIKKRELRVSDLYLENGCYPRYNIVAIVSLVIGIIPNIPGFIRAANGWNNSENFFDMIYPYSWFIGLFISGTLHLLLSFVFRLSYN